MNSQERVAAVFSGELPDRIPRWCGSSPEFWNKAKLETALNDEELRIRMGDDFRRIFSEYKGPAVELMERATWCSPFGIQREGIGYGQPMSHPMKDFEAISEVEQWSWPDSGMVDVSTLRAQASVWNGQYAVLGGEWSPFWHDVIDLVGHENLYFKMYDHPEMVKHIFERVTDYYFEASVRAFDAAADLMDIFFIGNDLGGQTGPLMGVEMFEEFIMPSMKRLIQLGHDYHLPVMLHCCGGYRDLMPSLIRAGIDGLHALQPDARGMDPASLKKDFGGMVVLNGAIDSHNILINGESPEWVREETRKVISVMKPGGRYIGGASHDTILEETPVENVLAMMDAIQEFGSY
ncbi:MAG: uroporphyrinogen decarboxylase family protein [Sphaerochaeta sp.]|nr:uroporphyrinogen decarboxylase family protein [Sphaerochaeta sp.]